MASRLSVFLDELKRRKVYRVAAVYGAVGVAIAIAIPDFFGAFRFPAWAAPLVIVIIAIGFPIALVLAWAYEVRPEEPRPVQPGEEEPTPPPRAVGPATVAEEDRGRSIAVLPFSDMSPEGDQEYFGDGVAEEVLNVLTRIPDLRVAARTSSFSYKDKACSIREIGQELGVATVLEGSVRKAGDRLRITAQLTETPSGFHLWSETYERKNEDVFAIQDDIARAIATTLRVTLLGEPDEPLVRTGTESSEAYDLYLKGRHRWFRRYKYGLQTALEYFERANRKDPAYALPHTGIADVHTILAIYGLLDPAEARRTAEEATERALALDPELPEAYFSRAIVRGCYYYDWDTCRRLMHRAVELRPDFAAPHVWMAMALANQGICGEEGLDHARKACALDPESPYISGVAGLAHTMGGRYPEAIAHLERALELEPEDVLALYGAGTCYSAVGRHAEAVGTLEKAAALSDRMTFVLGLLCAAYGRAGRMTEAEALHHELLERAGWEYVTPVALAWACANVGRPEDALDYLEQALAEANPTLSSFFRYPLWDEILSHPRYMAIAARMGMEPWDLSSRGT